MNFGTVVPGSDAVSAYEFGAVQTGFSSFDDFDEQFSQLGLSTLRWPGGTLSEVQPDIYGLEIDGLFDGTQLFNPDPNRERPDLVDMLAYAVEHDLNFSMIIPTARYVEDIDKGIADLQLFLEDLLSGAYGALPAHFTLEIGNEYDALAAFEDNAAGYGEIADAFISTIDHALNDPQINLVGAEIDIAVQMGYSAADDSAIRAEMSDQALRAIDSIVTHALPLNFGAIDKPQSGPDLDPLDVGETNWESRNGYHQAWLDAIDAAGGASPEVDLFVSAITIGAAANDIAEVELAYQDYGAAGSGAYLEMFSTLHSYGMDQAAFWGVAVSNLNAISYAQDGEMMLTPAGATISLMATLLPGLYLLDGFQANSRDDEIMAYAYEDADTKVVFLAANDIPSEGIEVLLDVEQIEGITSIEAFRVVTETGAPDNDPDAHLLPHATASLEAFEPELIGEAVSIPVLQDYETVAVVIELTGDQPSASPAIPFGDHAATTTNSHAIGQAPAPAGTGEDDTIISGSDSDDIAASGGDDFVKAGAGDDSIGGGEGHDTIYGQSGADVIGGGQGDDIIMGGAGNDIVAGGPGDDEIFGEAGNDQLSGSFGNDLIDGRAGNDNIGGGPGRDLIEGGSGDDTVGGGEGDDTIYGLLGDDFLAGGGRNDVISGGDGDDTINGGDGDDTLNGGAGGDQFNFNFEQASPPQLDIVEDFEIGLDSLVMTGVHGGPGSVEVTDISGGVEIAYEAHVIRVYGADLDTAELTAEHLTFL